MRMAKNSVRDAAGYALVAMSLVFPIASLKANRLASGEAIRLANLGWKGIFTMLAVPGAVCLAALAMKALIKSAHPYAASRLLWSLMPAAALIAVSSFAPAGGLAAEARYGLGAGFWLMSAGALLLSGSKRIPFAAFLLLAASIALAAKSGYAKDVSLFMEFEAKKTMFFSELLKHVKIALFSAAAAILPGMLLGYWCYASERAGRFVMGFVNLMQVLPTLSLFGLIMLPLTYISRKLPFLADLGIRGIGFAPAFIALGLYCLLPITVNTMAGFASVDKKVLFSAKAMGMTDRQSLVKVQLPLASPVIFSGIRTAVAQNLGNATIAGLVGGGGMGSLIFLGLAQAAPDLVLLGALPVITMALAADAALGRAERMIKVAVLHGDD